MSWTKRRAVFEKSYDEVLLALKHQDDKLNRTLTAIAFLTAAGVAIFSRVASDPERAVRFDGSSADATGVLFITFLVSVLFALLTALSAIGPSDALPRPTDSPLRDRWPSLLFWAKIIKQPNWNERINEDPSVLEECLARNLHSETETLANRVDYKVARSRESAAFVQIAVLSLALLGIFSIDSIRIEVRWLIGSTVALLVLALPLWDLWQMRNYKFPGAEAAPRSYKLVALVVIFAAALLFSAEPLNTHWWAAAYTIGAIFLTRMAYVHRRIANKVLVFEAFAGPVIAVLAFVF